jgi:lipopolysaccharide/colanic/teichoic acid biosynthesis glycosyltransferase
MKRLTDIILVVITMPLWLIAYIAVAFLIILTMGRPIHFRHERAGRNGKPFNFIKFRSMRNGEGSDAERTTRLGKLLRSTSLDELPQLWHVLSGKMSLVGPRPLPVRYLPRYSPFQNRRHEIRPGITGWAQINGRNAISWEKKFELDVWYVDNRSLLLDAKILFLTFVKVFKRSGITSSGTETMPEFTGPELTS